MVFWVNRRRAENHNPENGLWIEKMNFAQIVVIGKIEGGA